MTDLSINGVPFCAHHGLMVLARTKEIHGQRVEVYVCPGDPTHKEFRVVEGQDTTPEEMRKPVHTFLCFPRLFGPNGEVDPEEEEEPEGEA